MDGSMAGKVCYKDLDRIISYCEPDVVTLAQVFLRMRNDPSPSEETEVKRV